MNLQHCFCPECGDRVFIPSVRPPDDADDDPTVWCRDMGHWAGRLSECRGLKAWRGHLEIYPELCCEECGEVVHNHIDCPACGHYTGTDAFFRIATRVRERGTIELTCQGCRAAFRADKAGYDDNYTFERIA